MPENFTVLHGANEGSFSAGGDVSIISPPALFDEKHNEGEFLLSDKKLCVTDDANRTSPKVLTAPKPSFMKARKVRQKQQMEALAQMSLGVMQNGCSVSSRNPSKGFKQQHVISKFFHKTEELVDNSDLLSEQIPSVNGNPHSICSGNVPRAFPYKSDSDDGCSRTHDCTGSSRKEFESGCDANAVKQEGVLSSYLHTQIFTSFAKLVARVLRSQWNFLFHVALNLMLAWYHSFLFALHPLSYALRARAKAAEAYRSKELDRERFGGKSQSRALVIRPKLVMGARKLAFGCLTALYTFSMLTCLFVASFMLSFFIVKGFVYEPVQLYEYLFFDYTKQLPIASVNFRESMMYPYMGSPFRRRACPTRNFHATVYLTVPESDFNKELGIFQVTAELISATGQVLLSKTQPCMLRFRSTALQHVKAFLMAIPLLAGSYLETQTLAVSSLKWQEQRALSSAGVRIVLAPRAGRPLHSGLPELYEAGISVESKLAWWARLIGNWRWTLSVWLGLALFIGAVLIILGVCTQLLVPDLSLMFSLISMDLGKRERYKAKVAYHKLGKLGAGPTLGSENAESVNNGTT